MWIVAKRTLVFVGEKVIVGGGEKTAKWRDNDCKLGMTIDCFKWLLLE